MQCQCNGAQGSKLKLFLTRHFSFFSFSKLIYSIPLTISSLKKGNEKRTRNG